jgi:CelD/BcsL family acetyltransferase involved in cellulose biosynthesis
MPARLCQNSGMQHLQVRRLSERHFGAVIALERASYPRALQEAPALIRARLQHEDEMYSSLNLGLFDGDRLVGYVIAHLDDGTDCREIALGDNVYVADLAIRPAYRRHLLRLLDAFAREVRLEHPGVPVVAHAIGDTAEVWDRHEAILQRLGAGIATRHANTDPAIKARWLMVWRPATPLEAGRQPETRSRGPRRVPFRTRSGRLLDTVLVTDEEGLLELQDAWQRIEAACPGVTVFQTHRYLSEWVRCFGMSYRLVIVCVYDGEDLIGIAPLQIANEKMHRMRVRQLTFLGAPWQVDRPGFLFARDPAGCAEAVASRLLARRDTWDVIWFHEQTAGDAALEAFCETLAGHGLLHGRTASSRCPYLRFEGSWQELLASKSRKFRRNLQTSRRRLEALGRLEYESRDDGAELGGLLDEYQQLESRSWKRKAGVGVSRSVEHLRFYRKLAGAFGRGGEFAFRCLRLDRRMIAATFGLAHRRRYYSLHITHDAAFAHGSPGTYLESRELEECFAAGLDEYDFLGGFLRNKLRWATHARETVAVHLYQPQRRLRLVFWLYFVAKPRLKRLLVKLTGNRQPFVKDEEARRIQ